MLQIDVHDNNLNLYAGIAASAFPVGSLFSGVIYGRLSDKFRSRKRFIQIGLVFNILLYPVFGWFAGLADKSLFYPVVFIRCCHGLFNGNIGLARAAMGELCTRAAITTLAEDHEQTTGDTTYSVEERRFSTMKFDSHEDFKTLQQQFLRQGFSLLSVAYALGLAFGSVVGGTLSNVSLFGWSSTSLFYIRPYLLACLFTTALSCIGFTVITVNLRETYISRGQKQALRARNVNNADDNESAEVDEESPLLLANRPAHALPAKQSTWAVMKSLSSRVWIVCFINLLLGFAFNGFTEVFPLWSKASVARWGLDFDAFDIGIAHAISGPCGSVYQIFFYRKFVGLLGGVVPMLRLKSTLLFLVTLLFPLQHLFVAHAVGLWISISVSQALKSIGFGGAFASLYVLVNETATSVGGSNAGVVNGLGQAMENVGRAVAPAAIGLLYTYSTHFEAPTDPFLTFGVVAGILLLIALLAGFTAPEKDNMEYLQNIEAAEEDEEIVQLPAEIENLLKDVPNDNLSYLSGQLPIVERHSLRDSSFELTPTPFRTVSHIKGSASLLICGTCIGPRHEQDCAFYNVYKMPRFDADGEEPYEMYGNSFMEASVNVAIEAGIRAARLQQNRNAIFNALERVGARNEAAAYATAPALSAANRNVMAAEKLLVSRDNRCTLIVERFLNAFEEIRFAPPNDQFEEVGRHKLVQNLLRFVLDNKRIDMCLPAFPCKSPNNVRKTLGILPDKGEELALKRLDNFCAKVSSFYEPGCQLVIMSDGRVFADLVGVPDDNVTAYRTELHKLVDVKHIVWDTLDNHIRRDDNDHDKVRDELLQKYGNLTADQLDVNIRSHGESLLVYRGFIKFCMEDRIWPDEMSKSKIRKECSKIARSMMLRNVAFSRLVKDVYGNHLRLSIHAHNNAGPKYAVALLDGLRDLRTPWHNVVVKHLNGTFSLMHHIDALENGKCRLVERDGRPYYFEETAE